MMSEGDLMSVQEPIWWPCVHIPVQWPYNNG